jgi:bifunctional non-homologous end joining protein LigD
MTSALDLRIAPMMATTASLPRDDEGWAFEVKWDGVRAVTYIDGGAMRMESRNLLDITPRYPELAGLPDALAGRAAILDGEVVSFDEFGRPSFGRLQHRMHVANAAEVRRRMSEYPVVYLVFDVLWLDGERLVARPYDERRGALESLGLDGPSWQVPLSHRGDGAAMLEASRAQGLEGVVAKLRASVYEPGRRSRNWLKVKNVNRQEVVIGGWVGGEGNRLGRLGALLVGVHEGGALRFVGKVGTGFTDAMLDEMGRTLAPLARDTSPFANKVPFKGAHWVEPELVCDVEFGEWTSTGTLRHPSYKGLRDDKSPRDVVREPVSGGQ